MSFSGTKGYLTKPKPGVQINPVHPLSRGLVGYWLFNEGSGSRTHDISGKGNHGTLSNMLPNTQGSGWGGSEFGGGLQYDGVNDYVTFTTIGMHTSEGTIAFWIEPLGAGDGASSEYILSHRTSAVDNRIYLKRKSSDNNEFYVGFGNNSNLDTNHVLNVNQWYHLAITWIGADYVIYLDGRNVKSGTVIELPSIDANIYLGSYLGASDRFNGIVGPGCIYNRALPAKETKTLCDGPFCNLLQVPIRRHFVAAPPVGAIMNQFQTCNLGADLYNGALA